MPRDVAWKIEWPAGSITLHGSREEEVLAKALEYLKAKNLLTAKIIQSEYGGVSATETDCASPR